MNAANEYKGGENFDLRDVLLRGRKMNLNSRTNFFGSFIKDLMINKQMQHLRCVSSAADREVKVIDHYTGELKSMLMFGSNNYLGLANHPYIKEYVCRIIKKQGTGIGGPPLLNGYTSLHYELEERLAHLKGAEDVLIFSSGYGANVGLVSAIMGSEDLVVYDAYSHASFYDGIKMSGAQAVHFSHNDAKLLEQTLSRTETMKFKDRFVGVEGVYSMDGDIAPLDKIVPICKRNNSILVVDDAHGTGVMGTKGTGSAGHFGLEGQIDITMGTFSKTFAVTGGFVAASKPIINYLRFFARSYMFSASLPPTVVASVLAALDVLENESELQTKLGDNINYTARCLKQLGFDANSITPIFPLKVPTVMNIRKAAYDFHQKGFFVNSVEYPAVPKSQQRFRVSIMATHTKDDIDRLMEAIVDIWDKNKSGSVDKTFCTKSNKVLVN
ncbi:MAG: pyridoxal phosphate-dependent aminotransferase family protein [Ignavibacteriaceae bacterium]|nr:pyridoxal phosphate-dependent aminotransferase family protein [Ignavibacteria bacterium]MBT8392423.1 pyridoxal phosphate-dependent aminotransferase family protein [Ignavibacteria bacterium]NNL22670.1 pyridoxal phosphate-dependent aminotransferase family protein [Ignavibacteriaceae bacterium]